MHARMDNPGMVLPEATKAIQALVMAAFSAGVPRPGCSPSTSATSGREMGRDGRAWQALRSPGAGPRADSLESPPLQPRAVACPSHNLPAIGRAHGEADGLTGRHDGQQLPAGVLARPGHRRDVANRLNWDPWHGTSAEAAG